MKTDKIKPFEVTEGNLKAVKSTSDFGGPNMYYFHVKKTDGYWDNVQFMTVYNIQSFFKTKLPIYKETKTSFYELI